MDLIGGSTTSFNLTADAVTNLTLLLFYSLPNILNVSSTRESSTVYLDTRRNNNSDYKHDSPHYHSHSHLNGESPFFPPISSFLSSSSNWLLHEPIDSSSSQPPIMQSSSSSESDSYNDHSLTLDSERPFLQSTSFPLDSPFKLNNGDYSSSLESFPSFSLTIPLVNMSSDSNSNEDESQSSFRQPNNESKIFNQFDDQFSGLTDLTIGLTSSNVTENQVSSDWWSSSLSPSVIFKSNETIFTFNSSQDNDGEPSFPVDNNSIGLTPFNASNHVNQLVIEYNWFYLMLGLLVFVGCFGNILVCLAICLERRLQNATNFFLLSLAIADLLVSILVMPMSIVNEVYGYWPFGTLTCNFWVTCDVLCCSSSIYHMCFISVGRYVGIKNPLHARQARLLVSRRAVLFKIVLVWLIAALITSPITILGIADSSNIMPESAVCSISNKYFLIIGAFSAFYLPMIIMVNSYVLTVRLLRRKAKFCKNSGEHGKWPPSARSSINRKSHENQGDNGKYSGSSGNQNYCKKDFDTGKCKNTFTSKTRSLHSISDGADDFQRKTNHNHLGGKRLSSTGSLLRGHFGTEIRSRISKHYNTQPMMIRTLGSSVQVRTEQKATQVLGLVFFLFIICWSPFFTRNLIEAIFTDIQMPNSLPTIFLWLGYFSSTINPVIYTIFNRNFRRAFRRILLCQTIKYRLQRSSQSFNPNQRFGGRRGIYRYSNQNSPNNNNNSKHNDNNRSNSLNNSNNNVSNNSNRNVNSNNVLHNKLGSNNSENGRFYEDNVDLNNINLNMESNTDNVIDDDNNYHIHGYIYSKSGRLMDNMKSMKSIGSNGVEYSDDEEDGGDLDEDNDNDYLGSNEDDSTTFGSKICCTIKNKQLSDQVNAKYNSRSDECDNYRDKALNMRYYWKYSKADLKAKSEPVATIKCCSEV